MMGTISGKTMLRVVIMLMIFTVTDAVEKGPTKEDIEKIYKNSKPGYMVCYFKGSECKRGEEYCSSTTERCEPLFPYGYSFEEKVTFCQNITNKTSAAHGMYDECIYFFGKHAVNNGSIFKWVKDTAETPTLGKEFCSANNSCELGNEFCNSTFKKCEKLFPSLATDDEKREICEDVRKNNKIEKIDCCIYAIGKINWVKRNVSPTDNSAMSASTLGWLITLTILVAALIVPVVVYGVWRYRTHSTIFFRRNNNRNENRQSVQYKDKKDKSSNTPIVTKKRIDGPKANAALLKEDDRTLHPAIPNSSSKIDAVREEESHPK